MSHPRTFDRAAAAARVAAGEGYRAVAADLGVDPGHLWRSVRPLLPPAAPPAADPPRVCGVPKPRRQCELCGKPPAAGGAFAVTPAGRRACGPCLEGIACDDRHAGATVAELDATMAAVLAAGKPAWWDREGAKAGGRSVVFERFARGELFPWGKAVIRD